MKSGLADFEWALLVDGIFFTDAIVYLFEKNKYVIDITLRSDTVNLNYRKKWNSRQEI